jgi:phosphopantothenoylcysteine decarboxylase/phosphopantothenate--cysteine ligase
MSNPIAGKNILLGITGSIAAYKAADLASRLTQAGAVVDAILTPAALKFISALTFQSVTMRKAYTDEDLWGGEGHVRHIGLGTAGDLLVIAPASANTIARLAYGIADNLLTITALAARCPILVAPAMDGGMFSNPATQVNLDILRQRDFILVGPAEGRMASGLVGLGRMVEPAELVGHIRLALAKGGALSQVHVLVTAGGTQEPIDPVRVITNRSSGKQGYALAQAALDAGAEVTLVHTPTNLSTPVGAQDMLVHTAAEMKVAVLQLAAQCEIVLMAAAVADFRPQQVSAQKIKKGHNPQSIQLEPTEDILVHLAAQRVNTALPRIVVGFAAESQDLEKNAAQKLSNKHLDMIVANDISSPDAGFAVDTNRVTIFYPDGMKEELPLQSKTGVAEEIIQRVIVLLQRMDS